MSLTYSNYRWEPTNKRKGDRWHYVRDVSWGYNPYRAPEPQSIATVTYQAHSDQRHWGKWIVNFRPVSPALDKLRLEEKAVFSSRDEAMAWVTAMVALSL